MADAPPAGQQTQNMLTRKVGPFPVWVWAAIGAGVYFWYTRYGPGASGTSGTSQQATDPNTGVPYAQELAAAQQQSGEPVTVDVGAVTVTDTDQAPPPRRPPPRRPPPKRPPPKRPPPKRPPPKRRPGGTGGGGPVLAQSASRGPLDRPGEVNTVNSPVFDQWTADQTGVPEPQPAFAPMTAGSIYG